MMTEADAHYKRRSELMTESKAAFDAGEKGQAKTLSEQGKEEGKKGEEAKERVRRPVDGFSLLD